MDQEMVRVTLYKNTQHPTGGNHILIDPHSPLDQILQTCSERLGIPARKIFSEDGTYLNSFANLRDGAVLYVSQGENFQVIRSQTEASGAKRFVFVMLGAAAVGKSAITLQYVQNRFIKDYDPTIEDYYNKTAIIDGQRTNLSILDTAGMEDYFPLIDNWIDSKDGIVLVYSVEIPDSIEAVRTFYTKIINRYNLRDPQRAPIVVIAANKVDLQNRLVSREEGQALANELQLQYFESSAAKNSNINEIFAFMVRELRAKRTPQKAPQPKPWYKSLCNLL